MYKIISLALSIFIVLLQTPLVNASQNSNISICKVEAWEWMNYYDENTPAKIKNYLDTKLKLVYWKIENKSPKPLSQGEVYQTAINKITAIKKKSAWTLNPEMKNILWYISEKLTHKVKRIIANEKCRIKEESKILVKPVSLPMSIWEYYLISTKSSKTIISLDNFAPSWYLDWEIAPTMDIFWKYSANDYFLVLWTYVLPEWYWANGWKDGFRENINTIPFSFKLVTWNKVDSMTLDILPKGNAVLEIKKIDPQNEAMNLYVRDTLPVWISTPEIYEALRTNVKLSTQ